jgi:hypothetical protein
MTASQRRALVAGFIFLALGVMFLLEALGLYEIAPTLLWPLLLIALGVGVLSGVGGREGDNHGG